MYLLLNDSDPLMIWTEDKKILHDMGNGKKAYKERQYTMAYTALVMAYYGLQD